MATGMSVYELVLLKNTQSITGPLWREPPVTCGFLSHKSFHVIMPSSAQIIRPGVINRTTRTPTFWEYPLLPHDYPYYIDSYQIPSQNKAKSKIRIRKICTWHTFWSCLIRCVNMKWIRLVLWKLQSRHDSVDRLMDRRTDERTDNVKLVYPLSILLKGGV